jgi:hypothetical protein
MERLYEYLEELGVNTKEYDSHIKTVLNVLFNMEDFDKALATIVEMITDEKERNRYIRLYEQQRGRAYPLKDSMQNV